MADQIKLYGYVRSSCSGRLRIALALKSINYDYVPVNLLAGEHQQGSYAAINPSKSVPTLQTPTLEIPQSVAALEYLDEAFPSTPLLPADAPGRAVVRSMVHILSADVQPVTNMKMLQKADRLDIPRNAWVQEFSTSGLAAYEALVARHAGRYSYGDQITMADVCLAPAVWSAERFEVDLAPYPTMRRVAKELETHPAVQQAHWRKQVDCPEGLR